MKQINRESTVKPLSFLGYFRRNARKAVAMVLALAISVFMITVFKAVVFAVNEAGRLGDVASVENMTFVIPGSAGAIDPAVREHIANDPDVERAVPQVSQHTAYYHFFGTANVLVTSLRGADIPYVMEKHALRLTAGRLPEEGRNEVVLSRALANNKGLAVGDFIGKQVDPVETLQGRLKVVGLMDGGSMLGLTAVGSDRDAELVSLLVFPREGKLAGFNAWIEGVPAEQATYWDLRKAAENYDSNAGTLNTIFAILSLAVVLVMAFAAGNSSYAQCFSRRYEFGVLQSIGYTKAQILFRAAREIGIVNLAGFAGGFALSLAAGLVLDAAFFMPHGYLFRLVQPDGMLAALTVPLGTAVLGLIPAGWLLARTGPMTVVEKFE